MLGLDLSETTTVQFADVDWTIGLLPLLKFDEFCAAVEKANAPGRRHLTAAHRQGDGFDMEAVGACETCDTLFSQVAVELTPVYREAVRWGLRGTSAEGVALTTETARVAGRDYQVLSESVVDRLSRVGRGRLVQKLGSAIIDANSLDAREVLGFK